MATDVKIFVFDQPPSASGDTLAEIPIENAFVTATATLKGTAAAGATPTTGFTDSKGVCLLSLKDGPTYTFTAKAFGLEADAPAQVTAKGQSELTVRIDIQLDLSVEVRKPSPPSTHYAAGTADVNQGSYAEAKVSCNTQANVDLDLDASGGLVQPRDGQLKGKTEITREFIVSSPGRSGRIALAGKATATTPSDSGGTGGAAGERFARALRDGAFINFLPDSQTVAGEIGVSMRRAAMEPTEDLALWIVIRKSIEALSFANYLRFMDIVLCGEAPRKGAPAVDRTKFDSLSMRRALPFTDADAYRALKVATEAFLMVNCGVAFEGPFVGQAVFDSVDRDYVARRMGRQVDLETFWRRYLKIVNGTSEEPMLPYLALIRQKLADVRMTADSPDAGKAAECVGIIREKLIAPCLLELIWSYWHEEGMLVQTLNAVTRRFQNVRGPKDSDPLGNLEIDPLRSLNNFLWGYIQDEQHRLSVVRRNYEYDHHYGIRLEGKVVRDLRPADTRSKFLEAFHSLLQLCAGFFKQDDDTTVVADGFPLLNGLKEVHLILSEGAHNQFGDLPSTARIEMLMQQWLLARPEFREFLPTRIMVAYPEPWMDRVDAMKKIQGWTDTSVLHFRNLGTFGEQVLLSIRYGAWSDTNDPVQAANWARFWRPEIQGYTHAYRSVTGVDLTAANVGGAVDATLPSVHLQRRLVATRRSA